jgi:hypothetical protein
LQERAPVTVAVSDRCSSRKKFTPEMELTLTYPCH